MTISAKMSPAPMTLTKPNSSPRMGKIADVISPGQGDIVEAFY